MKRFGTVFTLCTDHIGDDPITSFGTVLSLPYVLIILVMIQ